MTTTTEPKPIPELTEEVIRELREERKRLRASMQKRIQTMWDIPWEQRMARCR